jgi:hypothetical protein
MSKAFPLLPRTPPQHIEHRFLKQIKSAFGAASTSSTLETKDGPKRPHPKAKRKSEKDDWFFEELISLIPPSELIPSSPELDHSRGMFWFANEER